MPDEQLIAIVDDDESVREAIASLLKALGFAAMAFGGAEAFLSSGRTESTACLITDVQMPGMSGLELYDRVAASAHPIPTVLITAYPDERARARALKAGVTGYLVKPFNEGALLGCIEQALGRGGLRGGTPAC